MNAYRWLPRPVIMANERVKLALLRRYVRLHPENEGARVLLLEQEVEVEKWRSRSA